MWKLLKADFKYNYVKLIGYAAILVLFAIAGIYFYLNVENTELDLDFLRGVFAGLFSVILFIPQIVHHQEKRNRLFRILPIKAEQVAKERIVTIIFEVIPIILLLVIFGLSTSFTENVNLSRLFSVFGILIFILSGFMFLRDKWFLFLEKKGRIIAVVKYFVLFTFPLSGFIWYLDSFFNKHKVLVVMPKDYLIAVVFILTGSAIMMQTITSYKKRKSYLD